MGEHVIKLPDVGEGVAEAELVEWHVKVGDLVREDTVLAAVMTDKATVEIPSPVDGEILWLGAEIGETIAVGSPLIRLKVEGAGTASATGKAEAPPAVAAPEPTQAAAKPAVEEAAAPKPAVAAATTSENVPQQTPAARSSFGVPRAKGEKPLASPAVRLQAKEAGVDLRQVAGSGPAGRVTHEDLEAFIARGPQAARVAGLAENTAVEDIRVIGLRRKIAEKMALSKSRIPHITYVEEIDVTALEELRAALNKEKRADRPKLTLLPFLMRAMVKAIAEQPNLNALYDDEAGVIHQHGGVHIGIAAQTPTGLVVPVVKHAEARDLWDCGAEVNRLAEAAKAGTATREELSGSTITITSLGAMGGVVTTPVINYPEVAIVGVNKMMVRPVWDGTQFIPRKMMNLSSSFDHRVIDGWDAAVFVQRIKTLLETPAMIFIEG
jgi:2-oxoisovalerate dehydrogenase E2 component (dihydrolipoyl transacylase)